MSYGEYWEILIVGGGVLIAFIVAIVKPLLMLNSTLTKLDMSVEGLGKDFTTLSTAFEYHNKANSEEHKTIFKKLSIHEERIGKVERR